MPWKNGRGLTQEIAAFPPGARLDGRPFGWRMSLAEVTEDCAFSPFPGCARTLVLVHGTGMRLSVDGEPPMDINARYQPFSFSGDAMVHCSLLSGPVRDLNVMTTRSAFTHTVQILHLAAAPTLLPATAAVWAMHILAGTLFLQCNSALSLELDVGETVMHESGDGAYGRIQVGSLASGRRAPAIAVLAQFTALG